MMQAMIFAAGMGTRLKPLTDTMPKAMVKVGGQPLIRHVVQRLAEAGTERIVVNVHHFASQIVDYLSNDANTFGTHIIISDETDKLLDTGGGIKKAAKDFCPDAPVLIHNVDILSNVDLARFYAIASTDTGNGTPDALLLVSKRKTSRYLLFDDGMRLVGWTNIATGELKSPYHDISPERCHMYAFAGIHAISPRMFPLMESFPDKFGIIDFYLQTCASHRIMGYAKPDMKLMDIGKLDTLSHADEFLSTLSTDEH